MLNHCFFKIFTIVSEVAIDIHLMLFETFSDCAPCFSNTFLGQVLQSMIYNPGLSLSLMPGTTSFLLIIVFLIVLGWLKTNSIPADFKSHFFSYQESHDKVL